MRFGIVLVVAAVVVGPDLGATAAASGFVSGDAAAALVTGAAEEGGEAYQIRQTPFGPMRFKLELARPAPRVTNAWATEDGENIRFRRATLFGVEEWVSKKTALTKSERLIWDQAVREAERKDSSRDKERE
jgi:hypothetical protein